MKYGDTIELSLWAENDGELEWQGGNPLRMVREAMKTFVAFEGEIEGYRKAGTEAQMKRREEIRKKWEQRSGTRL